MYTLYATDLKCQIQLRMWLALQYELWTGTGTCRRDTMSWAGQMGRARAEVRQVAEGSQPYNAVTRKVAGRQ